MTGSSLCVDSPQEHESSFLVFFQSLFRHVDGRQDLNRVLAFNSKGQLRRTPRGSASSSGFLSLSLGHVTTSGDRRPPTTQRRRRYFFSCTDALLNGRREFGLSRPLNVIQRRCAGLPHPMRGVNRPRLVLPNSKIQWSLEIGVLSKPK